MPCKCPPTRARKVHSVKVQTKTDARDKYGDPHAGTGGGFGSDKKRKALVVPLSGREFLRAQQTVGEVSHRVEMRREKGLSITPKHRLVWTDSFDESHNLNVIAVITPVQGNAKEMDVMCKEEV